MLGVVIGVGAVIAMVTIGNGTTAQVQSEISALGTNLLFLRPGPGFRPAPDRRAELHARRRRGDRATRSAGLQAVAPTASASAKAVYGNQNWSTTITGTTDDFFVARDWPLTEGRNFLDSELRSGKAVCIIGTTVRKELFGASRSARREHPPRHRLLRRDRPA